MELHLRPAHLRDNGARGTLQHLQNLGPRSGMKPQSNDNMLIEEESHKGRRIAPWRHIVTNPISRHGRRFCRQDVDTVYTVGVPDRHQHQYCFVMIEAARH
jgi:hypothetical protein